MRSNPIGEGLFLSGEAPGLAGACVPVGTERRGRSQCGRACELLLGMRSETGWWYYFPVVFAVKSTMAALAATLILLSAGIVHGR